MPFEPGKQHHFAHITLEKAPFGILWHDIMGNFVRVNLEAARLLGYTKEELITKQVFDIDAVYTLQMMQELWSKIHKEGAHHFESIQKRKDGTLYPAELVTVIFTFEETEYACTFFRDVTERTEREAKLRQALKDLEVAKRQLTRENVYLKEEIGQTYNSREIIGDSKVLKEVLKRVGQVAKTKATVLILGETGTGKELIARAIHEMSGRRSRSLVKVNCATLPATLIESELFGHEKGAFTGATSAKAGKFELADRGSIFLDEIGEMPLELQTKLLRVLQEGEFERLGGEQTKKVDVRVIAATNRNLEALISNNEFREDLYYRLNVFPIICPPLRNRKEDIPQLTTYFIKKYAGEIGKKIEDVPEEKSQSSSTTIGQATCESSRISLRAPSSPVSTAYFSWNPGSKSSATVQRLLQRRRTHWRRSSVPIF